MPVIVEDRLELTFPDDWTVIKYDEDSAFLNGLRRLQGSKAVDVIALAPRGPLFLIEIKDFRGHAIENRGRLRGPLFRVEIPEKVRDTVAGVIGAFRMRGGDSPSRLWPVVNHLSAAERHVVVLAWIEEDHEGPLDRQKARASSYMKELGPPVRWLTQHVKVASTLLNPLADLGVGSRYLPST
jgi:hypothetical protein